MSFSFDDLVILEMANNHQGDLAHGLLIVEEMAKISRKYGIRAAVKLQYRDLDSFIHPDFSGREDVKHIPRFESTRLAAEDYQALVMAIKRAGMVAVVTPFDERSVDVALNHGVDVLKVASCSCLDWPLLEKISEAGRPMICSVGGCTLQDVDNLASFFEHRGVVDLALLHCIGKYPTPDEDQQLGFMRRMSERYPHFTIGYSGHEAPDNLRVVTAAVAMGARVLERHVGVPTDQYQLNAYSMNPEEVSAWVEELLHARRLSRCEGGERQVSQDELDSLRSLKRGVYLKQPVEKGDSIDRDMVFFAMPCADGQISSGEFVDQIVASKDYDANEALEEARNFDVIKVIRQVVHEAKGLLREARIPTGSEYSIELSHHYGMGDFRRFGAVIVNFINREYCKKLIILLPGQNHPNHHHAQKEETFQILFGEMTLELNGETKQMKAGDIQLVRRGEDHSFRTGAGCIFEEISTTHIVGDSYYSDRSIRQMDPIQRKTVIDKW